MTERGDLTGEHQVETFVLDEWKEAKVASPTHGSFLKFIMHGDRLSFEGVQGALAKVRGSLGSIETLKEILEFLQGHPLREKLPERLPEVEPPY